VNLVKGAFKLHPRLVGKEAEGFVYGYNLKRFPDEPIKVGAGSMLMPCCVGLSVEA
jgi:hypothetical protein